MAHLPYRCPSSPILTLAAILRFVKGLLAADFVTDLTDGLLVGEQGWLATGDFKKPGFSQKPGFWWVTRLAYNLVKRRKTNDRKTK